MQRLASGARYAAMRGGIVMSGSAPVLHAYRPALPIRRGLLGTASMAALGLALAMTTPSHATDWTGATSNNWFTGTNWSAGVPNGATVANIDTVTPNATVVGATGAQASLLTVGVSGTGMLTIQN